MSRLTELRDRVLMWGKGWRNFTLAVITFAAGAILSGYDALQAMGVDLHTVIGETVPTKYVGVTFLGLGLLIGLLRYFTTTAIFRKE